MKKIIINFFLIAILISLFGCNKNNESINLQTDVSDESSEEVIEEKTIDVWDIEPVFVFDDIYSLNGVTLFSKNVNDKYKNKPYYERGVINDTGKVLPNVFDAFISIKRGPETLLYRNYGWIDDVEYHTYSIDKELNIKEVEFVSPLPGVGGWGFLVLSKDNKINEYISDYEYSTGNTIYCKVKNKYSINEINSNIIVQGDNLLIYDNNCIALLATYIDEISENLNERYPAIKDTAGKIEKLSILKEQKLILINNDNIKVVDTTCNSLLSFFDGVVKIKDNENLISYIDLNGNIISEGLSDGYDYSGQYVTVCKNDKWGVVNKSGELVVDFIFDDAGQINDGKCWVNYKGKTGKLNLTKLLDNNIKINDDLLDIDSFTPLQQIEVIADSIRIRKTPSSDSDKWLGLSVIKGSSFNVFEIHNDDNYAWYRIGDECWIADKDGKWIKTKN